MGQRHDPGPQRRVVPAQLTGGREPAADLAGWDKGCASGGEWARAYPVDLRPAARAKIHGIRPSSSPAG